MAIGPSGLCISYKAEILDGIHQAGDVYMIALFTDASNISVNTAAYAPAGESVGAGYVAGGLALAGRTVTVVGDVAFVDFADPAWPNITLAAQGALIYNATRANRAVAVINFGGTVSSVGPYSVTFPAPGPATALLRIK